MLACLTQFLLHPLFFFFTAPKKKSLMLTYVIVGAVVLGVLLLLAVAVVAVLLIIRARRNSHAPRVEYSSFLDGPEVALYAVHGGQYMNPLVDKPGGGFFNESA